MRVIINGTERNIELHPDGQFRFLDEEVPWEGAERVWSGNARKAILQTPPDIQVSTIFDGLTENLPEDSLRSWTEQQPGGAESETAIAQIRPLTIRDTYEVEFREISTNRILEWIDEVNQIPGVHAEPELYWTLPQVTERDEEKGREAVRPPRTVSDTAMKAIDWSEHLAARREVLVGVLDTGIDTDHENLKTAMARDAGTGALLGLNSIDGSGDLYDEHGHGTSCAGIIGARSHGKGKGVIGLCSAARLVPLKAIGSRTQQGTQASIITALAYARRKELRIVSASWGNFQDSKFVQQAIACLAESNTLFVASAGDQMVSIDQYRYYPACYNFPHVLSVGAYDIGNSNYGSWVHLTAPGKDLFTTCAYTRARIKRPRGIRSGVSMATAVAAGAAAILRSIDPSLSAAQVRDRLINSTTVGGPPGRSCSEGQLHIGNGVRGQLRAPAKPCATIPAVCRQQLERAASFHPQGWRTLF